jgi:hypothetical protein
MDVERIYFYLALLVVGVDGVLPTIGSETSSFQSTFSKPSNCCFFRNKLVTVSFGPAGGLGLKHLNQTMYAITAT